MFIVGNNSFGKRNSNLFKLPLQFMSNAKPVDIIQGMIHTYITVHTMNTSGHKHAHTHTPVKVKLIMIFSMLPIIISMLGIGKLHHPSNTINKSQNVPYKMSTIKRIYKHSKMLYLPTKFISNGRPIKPIVLWPLAKRKLYANRYSY